MATRRQEFVDKVDTALKTISIANQFNTDFDKVSYWQDTPSEYESNHLNYQDEEENYDLDNRYDADLFFCIKAVVVATDKPAPTLGTLAIEDLILAMETIKLCGATLTLVKSDKYTETKGKQVCHVDLRLKFSYKFSR